MKKMTFFLYLFLFLVLYITPGCRKEEPVEPIIPPVLELSLVLTATPETLEEAGTSMIEIIAVADSTVSDLPGATFIAGSFTKSVETPRLENTTTFHFKSYLNGEVTHKNVSVYVRPIPLPTIVLTSTVDTLDIGGGEVTITITTTNADSVFSVFDGKMLLPNCSESYTIDTTTTFVYEAYGPGGTISKYITVFVDTPPPPLTLSEYLCLETLQMVKVEYVVNGVRYTGNMGCDGDNLLDFFPDQTLLYDYGEDLCNGDPVNPIVFQWVLTGDSLYFNSTPWGRVYKILHASADTIIWQYCFNDGSCTIETYTHPSSEE